MSKKRDLVEHLMSLLTRQQMEKIAKEAERVLAPPPPEVDWNQAVGHCPRCHHQGPVIPDFGIKTVRGITRPQSWCRTCRSQTSQDYYRRPRKNATRHR